MTSSPNLDQLTAEQLRALAAQLLTQVDAMGKHLTAVPAASSSVFTGVVGITSQQFALVGLNGFTTQSIR